MARDGSLIFDTRIDDKGFKKGMDGLKNIGTKSLSEVNKAIKGTVVALGAIGIASTKVGMDFEKGMSRVGALSGATDKELKRLERTAMDLGRTTVFSATEASEGMQMLAMAGFKTNEIIDAMPGLLNAAAAGQVELGTAADITSNILSGFGIEASETGRVSDVLAKTFTSSNTSLESLGETMKYAAPIASAAGFSLEEVAAAAGFLGDAGIQGGQAGTTLRSVMLRLIDPPKQAADALNQLGVSATDSNGKMKPLHQIIGELDKATEGMTESQRAAIISQIAGQQAASGLLAILDEGGDSLREFTEELENSGGTAERVANEQIDNLAGDIELLKSGLEGAGIAIYKSFDTPLRNVTQSLTGHIEEISKTLTAHDDIKAKAEEMGTTVEQLGIDLSEVPSGLDAAVQVTGEIMAEMVEKTASFAPKMIEVGRNLILSFIGSILENKESLIESIVLLGAEMIATYMELVPEFMILGIEMITGLITGIVEQMPMLVEQGQNSILRLAEAIVDNLPIILDSGIKIILSLVDGIVDMLPELMTMGIDLIIQLADTIINNLPAIVDAGIDIIIALIEGIINNLPTLIEEAPRIINDFASAIYDQLPKILKAGIDILLEIIKGLIQTIPTLIANLPQIIMAIVNAFTLYNWWNLGKTVITNLGQGIVSMVGNLGTIARDLASSAIEAIRGIFRQAPSVGSGFVRGVISGIGNLLGSLLSTVTNLGSRAISTIGRVLAPSNLASVGSDMVKGIWNGINNVTGWILDKIKGFGKSVMKGIKGIFGIKSPSTLMRDEIGKNLALGIGVGFEAETDDLSRDINKDMAKLSRDMQATVDLETAKTSRRVSASSNYGRGTETVVNNNDNGVTQNLTIVSPERTPSENAREIRKVGRDLALGY